MQALATEKVTAQASTARFPYFVDFCMMSFITPVQFCSGRIISMNPGSSLFFGRRALLAEAGEYWTSDLYTKCMSCSPLQMLHRRRYQSHPRTVGFSASSVRLILLRLFDSASCSLVSVDSNQKLGNRTTAFAQPPTSPPPLSQHLSLFPRSQPFPYLSNTGNYITTRSAEVMNTTHGHGHQIHQLFRHVAEVGHVVTPDHVLACLFELALTPHL